MCWNSLFTKFSDITQCNGHYSGSFKITDFGTSRKLIYDFLLLINNNLPPILHRFQVMASWLFVKFSLARWECLTLTLSLGVIPCQYRHKRYIAKTRFFGLHFRCRKYWCIFNHFCEIRLESNRIRWNYVAVMAITPFKVIQGHRVWYKSKAHIQLPNSY